MNCIHCNFIIPKDSPSCPFCGAVQANAAVSPLKAALPLKNFFLVTFFILASLGGNYIYHMISLQQHINKVVADAKKQHSFPVQINEYVSLVDITASFKTINFIFEFYINSNYQLKDSDNEEIKRDITHSVCSDEIGKKMLDDGVNVKFIYSLNHGTKYTIKLDKKDCK